MKFNSEANRYESIGRFFDEFAVGTRFRTASKTLYEADIVNFIGLAGVHEELYTNVEYAEKHTIFGRRFAPGPLTFVLAEGLVIQSLLFEKTGMALLETNMKLVNPLFLGDTFHVDLEVLEKRETSKPDRGILKFLHHIDKTDGTRVAIITKTRMVRRLSTES